MKYIFNTNTTMKEYNNDEWWIDGNIVKRMRIESDSLEDALKEYKSRVEEERGIEISKNALKNKNPMYVDTTNGEVKQIGYVITGKTAFEKDNYKWVNKYINLWVEILTVIDTEFQEDRRRG